MPWKLQTNKMAAGRKNAAEMLKDNAITKLDNAINQMR